MGVSIEVWRATIGLFNAVHLPLNCRCALPKLASYALLQHAGYVILTISIMLLMISGIERNPGPQHIIHYYPVRNVRNMCFHIAFCVILRHFSASITVADVMPNEELLWLHKVLETDNACQYQEAVHTLYCIWSCLSPQFEVGAQHDIHEYMLFVMSHLQSNYGCELSSFQERTVLKCNHCSYQNEQCNNIHDIMLDLCENFSDSLVKYFSDDAQGIDDFLCPSCAMYGASITKTLPDPPTIISCVLQRFSRNSKNILPTKIDNILCIGTLMYAVSCVIIHHGDHLNTGHYSAIVSNGDTWLHINDDVIEKTTLFPHTLVTGAYIVFLKSTGCNINNTSTSHISYSSDVNTSTTNVHLCSTRKQTECQILQTRKCSDTTGFKPSQESNQNIDKLKPLANSVMLEKHQEISATHSVKRRKLSLECRNTLRNYLKTNPKASYSDVTKIFDISKQQYYYYSRNLDPERNKPEHFIKLKDYLTSHSQLDYATAKMMYPNLTFQQFNAVRQSLKKRSPEVNITSPLLPSTSVVASSTFQPEIDTLLLTSIKKFKDRLQDYPHIPCGVCHMRCTSSQVVEPDLMTKKILLDQSIADSHGLLVCQKCLKWISHNKTMPANVWVNLHNGTIPKCLQNLNPIEKRLISLVQPFLSVATLPFGQKSFKGQAIHFPTDSLQVVSSLPNISNPYIVVEQATTKDNTYHLANKTKVKNALTTLKERNSLYSNVTICEKNLAILNSCALDHDPTKDVELHFSIMPMDYTNEITVKDYIEGLPTVRMPKSFCAPLNMFDTMDLEEKCFPWLFPFGRGTYHQQSKLSLKQYCATRIYHKSGIYAHDPSYIFWLFNLFQLQQLKTCVNIAFRKKNLSLSYSKTLSLDYLCNKNDLCQYAWTMMKKIRGTAGYWQSVRTDVLSMFATLGPPTFFLSFSANDINWIELYIEIAHLNNLDKNVKDLSKTERISLLNSNCAIAVDHFMRRWLAFFRSVILGPAYPLGHILDYFWRVEIQGRGSPHIHLLLWVENAPNLDTAEGMHAAPAFIDKYITVNIPPENDKLHDKVVTLQTHSHTFTCQSSGNKRRNCRFLFPHKPTANTHLKYLDGLSQHKHFYELKRSYNECWINAYNPILLDLWGANMDIQLIGSTIGMVYYLTTYICKPETDTDLKCLLNTAINGLAKNSSAYKSLFKLGGVIFSQRKVSLQEAVLLLSDHPLLYKSRQVQYIDINPPTERVFIGRTEKDSESTDIQSDLAIQIDQPAHFMHYANRPASLDHLSLYEFVSGYRYSSTPTSSKSLKLMNNDGFVNARRNNCCLKWPKISLSSEKDKYFYHLLLLHLPHRNELELIIPHASYYHAFHNNRNSIIMPENNKNQYRLLMDMLQMTQSVNQEFIDDVAAHFAPSSHEFHWNTEYVNESEHQQNPDLSMINTNDISTEHSAPCMEPLENDAYDTLIRNLNQMQTKIFHIVHRHVKEIVAYLTGQVSQMPTPMYLFVSGSAGTGKTKILHAIRQLLIKTFPPNGACIVSAPTGVAAHLISGTTIHRAYHLPVQHCSFAQKNQLLKLSDEKLHQFRNLYADVHYNIIDEISMVSYSNFVNIHLRLNEILMPNSTNALFGNTSVICFGDLMQLRPVMAKYIFEHPKDSENNAIHLWLEKFVMTELSENMRQNNDNVFSNICNHLRNGQLTEQDIIHLRSRILSANQLAQIPFKSALRIFPTNEKCTAYNNAQLKTLLDNITIEAQDIVIASSKYSTGSFAPANIIPSDDKDCAGLQKNLTLAPGAKVMLRRNLDTQSGLVNGARGIITSIDTSISSETPAVYIKFDNVNTGSKYQNCDGNIRIEPVTAQYYALDQSLLSRKQLPISVSYAVTIHRCQGLTLDHAVLDLGKDLFQTGMAYVAISRLKKLDDLAITEFDPASKGFKVSAKCLDEMHRLRSLPDS